MISRRKGRRLAVQALYSRDVGNIPVNTILTFPWYDRADDEDLSFPRLLVQGVIQEQTAVDAGGG